MSRAPLRMSGPCLSLKAPEPLSGTEAGNPSPLAPHAANLMPVPPTDGSPSPGLARVKMAYRFFPLMFRQRAKVRPRSRRRGKRRVCVED